MGNDVPMIPLFQRPTYLVYKTSVKGMVDNPSSQGPSFNAEAWTKGGETRTSPASAEAGLV